MTTVPNWLAFVGLVVPAATGLAGYLLAGRNERARDERAARRETIARRASVNERLEEQRHAFQRETLLDLQDGLQRMIRSAAKINLHDRSTLKEHGTLTQVGDDLSDENYEIGVATQRLRERVLDPALRDAVEQFRRDVARAAIPSLDPQPPSIEDAISQLDDELNRLGDQYRAVSDLVGAALRLELEWLPGEVQAASST